MELLPVRVRAKLVANHHLQRALGRFDGLVDLHPVTRIFVPGTFDYWVVSELDPEDPDFFFGLCASRPMPPRLGHARFSWLLTQADRAGHRLERDMVFVAAHPLSHYLTEAAAAHAARFRT